MQMTAPLVLVIELLAWVAARPRTYGETMDAWRTSCPRFPVWEDALEGGLVCLARSDSGGMVVEVTTKGRAILAQA
jgi:hypothetical protein